MNNVAGMTEPRTMKSSVALPQRKDLEAEIAGGAYWLREERSHKASSLVRTYQIRLNIAEDQSLGSGLHNGGDEPANGLRFLVQNLHANPDRNVTCFLLRNTRNLQYLLFEDEVDGSYLGSVVGRQTE